MRLQLSEEIDRVRAKRVRGTLRQGVPRSGQLIVLFALYSSTAHADGTIEARGVYYKERATRVEQPMLDGSFEVGERGLLDAHLLADAITSASAGAGAANGTPFSKTRYEGGATYTHELDPPSGQTFMDRLRAAGEGRFSTENNYRSIFAGVHVEAELADKNAVVGIGGGISADRVDVSGSGGPFGGLKLQCPGDAMPVSDSCPLTTYLGSVSVSQIVSPNAVVAATYDISSLHGYQSNPYRQVVTEGGLMPEKHPYSRLRQAIAVSGRLYIPDTETTLIAAYRYYHDDWKIDAHTPELRIVQQVGLYADASVRYRYYTQSAAFFYEKTYPDPTMDPSVMYLTYDPKMTAFDGHLMEAKLGVLGQAFDLGGTWAKIRFEGILEYIVQHNRFGNAVEAHVAVTVPFEY